MTPIEDQFPYANNFVRGATPNTAFYDAWEPNPFRVHAPPPPVQPEQEHVPVIYRPDEGNTQVQRVPDQALQSHMNEPEELPYIPAYKPKHAVQVPPVFFQSGWMQSFVPSFGRRSEMYGAAPAVVLSRPIVSKTYQDIGARAAIMGKAPKVR